MDGRTDGTVESDGTVEILVRGPDSWSENFGPVHGTQIRTTDRINSDRRSGRQWSSPSRGFFLSYSSVLVKSWLGRFVRVAGIFQV